MLTLLELLTAGEPVGSDVVPAVGSGTARPLAVTGRCGRRAAGAA
ncbi:MAG TPA: hypothetical protein VGI74_09515 [Streptosporangiaceae bacterium]